MTEMWPTELDRMERAQSGDAYAVLDRPAGPKRLTAEQIAELREMAASQFMIPVIEKPVLAALLDAYEKMHP